MKIQKGLNHFLIYPASCANTHTFNHTGSSTSKNKQRQTINTIAFLHRQTWSQGGKTHVWFSLFVLHAPTEWRVVFVKRNRVWEMQTSLTNKQHKCRRNMLPQWFHIDERTQKMATQPHTINTVLMKKKKDLFVMLESDASTCWSKVS